MKKKWIHDHSGMSLVEIIIVIAMIAILAGSSYIMFNNVRATNLKDTVETIDSRLDKLQMETMSKSGNPFLYIYKLSDGYYMKILKEKLTSFDSTKLDTNGTKVAGNDVKIYQDSEVTSNLVNDGGRFIRIAYSKSMAFSYADSDTNVNSIVIKGISSYEIKLMKETGKHIVY